MKKSLAMTIFVGLLAACGGGGGGGNADDFEPLELRSATLQPRAGDACDIVGTIFSDDDDDLCQGFIEFDAFDGGGNRVASARHVTGEIPPQQQTAYVAPLAEDGNPVSCSTVADIRVSDADTICD